MLKKSNNVLWSVSAALILLVIAGCGDDTPTGSNAKLPVLITAGISKITQITAQCGGTITSDGGAAIAARGVCWSTNQTPTVADDKTVDGTGTGSFTSAITDLTANTAYYVRAYATNSVGTGYGMTMAFKTSPLSPALTTADVSGITGTTAQCGGTVTSDGGAPVTARGVCWSTNQTPTVADSRTFDGIGTGSFTSTITGLTVNAPYYVRAYATNSTGTGYGTIIAFTTSEILPVLTTTNVSEITQTTAQCGGTITSDGGATVTARGVCWSTNRTPTVADNKTTDGTGTGSFTSSITGLTGNTSYYVRAYATNSAGTGYGITMAFTTSEIPPVVITAGVSQITQTTAQCGGIITSDGGAAVTTRGVCWSTNATPTIADDKTTDGAGTGGFISSITGLIGNTAYYVRAYATNGVGTGYGMTVAFTTSPVLPVLATADVSAITGTTAQCGGTITTDGGAAVTARGVCWSTNATPTTADNKTTDGSGTGSFTSSITGLIGNTAYHVRAYATNSAGTAYGMAVTFTTSEAPPALITAAISEITETTAQCGGTVLSDGGAAVTARGVCWSTNATPTTADNITTDGAGTGTFASSITGLTANTTYYVRAYATNSVGTGYGLVAAFQTNPGPIMDIDGNLYQTVKIGDQWWMAENLKVTHYRNGDPIPNVSDSAAWAGLTTGAYCDYDNNVDNAATYGRLYNWYAVADSRNIAPVGWHVPTDAEWKQLEMFLGMSPAEANQTGPRGTDEGGKLKEAGTTHWLPPNTGATNESGFSALPAGYRLENAIFLFITYHANFWSSTEDGSIYAWNRYLNYDYSKVYRYDYIKRIGHSVRCVRN